MSGASPESRVTLPIAPAETLPARTRQDLRSAIEGAVDDARERLGLAIDLTYLGERLVHVGIVAIVDELVREALENVARHAGVRHADVDVEVDGELWVRVRDHGRGFHPAGTIDDPQADTHLVRALRAARLGGASAFVASAPGQGTMLRLRMPIHPGDGGASE